MQCSQDNEDYGISKNAVLVYDQEELRRNIICSRGGDTMLAILLSAIESDKDRQKFVEIYEKYHIRMERTAIRILKEQSDAEDAVQNAFVQIIKHFEKIYEISSENLPFWIISIVKNEALSILRKNQKITSLEDKESF